MTLIFIGTLHGFTSEIDLVSIIKKYSPLTILVEISQKDIKTGSISHYPLEMKFIYNWAIKNNISVKGFDCDINVFAPDKGSEDNQKVIDLQSEIISQYDWTDFNKQNICDLLDISEAQDLIDKSLFIKREIKLAENISSFVEKEGLVLVFTGVSHLKYFEHKFPNALFPFRN